MIKLLLIIGGIIMIFISPLVGIILIILGLFMSQKVEKGLPKSMQSKNIPIADNVFSMVDKMPQFNKPKRKYPKRAKRINSGFT